MLYPESAKLLADLPGKESEIRAIDALLANNQGRVVLVKNAAFLLDLSEEALERFLQHYEDFSVVRKEQRGTCPLCEHEMIESSFSPGDNLWHCDICGRTFDEERVEVVDCYRVKQLPRRTMQVGEVAAEPYRAQADNENAQSTAGGFHVTAELIRYAKTRPWSALDADEYLRSVKTFGDSEIEWVLKMLEARGFCLLRFEGTGVQVEILQALESALGPARSKQNDFNGKIKQIEPKLQQSIEATTGDSARALGFHTDGTQDSPLPPAILAFQYITSPTFGGLSTFLDLTQVVHEMPEAERTKILTDLAHHDAAVSEKKGLRYEGPLVKPVCADQSLSFRFRYEDPAEIKEAVLTVAEPYRHSFELLHQHIAERSEWLTFAPKEGDIAIFDNWRVLHGRESVQGSRHPRYHNRMWIDSLHQRHQGKYLLGVRGLPSELIGKIKLLNNAT